MQNWIKRQPLGCDSTFMLIRTRLLLVSKKIRIVTARSALLLVMLFVGCGQRNNDQSSDAATIKVYAAASLTDVVTQLAEQFKRDTGVDVKCNFASTSTLAKQIQAGAPADIFVSANSLWMDATERDGLIDAASRIDLLGNTLVVIAPADEAFPLDVDAGQKLESAFRGKLAMGDPEHVPAGTYAKQALSALGSWDALKDHVVFANDVRGVLTFVERGETGAGIVYATDARMSDKVKVVAELPADSHEKIVYPAALTRSASTTAQQFFDYLQSDDADEVFRDAGFSILSSSP